MALTGIALSTHSLKALRESGRTIDDDATFQKVASEMVAERVSIPAALATDVAVSMNKLGEISEFANGLSTDDSTWTNGQQAETVTCVAEALLSLIHL